MILKIIEKFHRDREKNITEGLKALDHKDLDKRLTDKGITIPTNQLIKITKQKDITKEV